MEYLSHSVEETEALGCRLAQELKGGAVIACRGGLGMGKFIVRAVMLPTAIFGLSI